MGKNKFPYLTKAILDAPTLKLPRIDGKGVYEFKAYPFGEAGLTLEPELIKEIRRGLVDCVKKYFPDFDLIVGIDYEGGIWGGLLAHDLKKGFTEFFPLEGYKSSFMGTILLLLACYFDKPVKFVRCYTKRYEPFRDSKKSDKYGFFKVRSAYETKWLGYNRDSFKPGSSVLLFDDLISEGGTANASLNVLINELNVEVVGMQVILAKSDKYREVERKWSVPIKFLATLNENAVEFSV